MSSSAGNYVGKPQEVALEYGNESESLYIRAIRHYKYRGQLNKAT